MKLVAGPWVGEFGWELFCWQGHIRKLSKKYKETTIICRTGHEFLYKDFATSFINFDPICEALNGFRCEGQKNNLEPPKGEYDYIDGSNFNINFDYNGKEMNREGLFFEQEFIKNKKKEGRGVLINIRSKCSDRDWPYEKWLILSEMLLKDGYNLKAIGTKEMSLTIKGAEDYRGISLEDLSNLMNESSLLISPSSGPAHFASLCGLKHLVWSDEFNRLKYLDYWNPFKTECIFYSNEGWNPKPESIYKLCH